MKKENNEFKKSVLKILHYYFDDINKFEDFDFDITLLDEKSYDNTLTYEVPYKTLIVLNLYVLHSLT